MSIAEESEISPDLQANKVAGKTHDIPCQRQGTFTDGIARSTSIVIPLSISLTPNPMGGRGGNIDGSGRMSANAVACVTGEEP